MLATKEADMTGFNEHYDVMCGWTHWDPGDHDKHYDVANVL